MRAGEWHGEKKVSSVRPSTAAAKPASERSLNWRNDAVCRDADPEVFFPAGDVRSAQAQVRAAKLICRGCPVSVTCLSWALASGQEAGIWGGLTEDERRRLHWRGRSYTAPQTH